MKNALLWSIAALLLFIGSGCSEEDKDNNLVNTAWSVEYSGDNYEDWEEFYFTSNSNVVYSWSFLDFTDSRNDDVGSRTYSYTYNEPSLTIWYKNTVFARGAISGSRMYITFYNGDVVTYQDTFFRE